MIDRMEYKLNDHITDSRAHRRIITPLGFLKAIIRQ